TVNSKRAEISLKKKVDPKLWNVKRGNMEGNTKEIKIVNMYISQVRNDLFEIYVELKQLDGIITAEQIKDKYIGGGIVHRKLLEVFDEHNNDLEELVGKDFVKATVIKYKTVRKK